MSDDDKEIIIRLDERTKFLINEVAKKVTKQEFEPVKRIVYGAVGVALLSILGAILALIIKQ